MNKKLKPASIRVSVSFPREIYEMIERTAAEQRVSVAWVVREAVRRQLAERWPLLSYREGEK
jgi:metal-responsive CopG/Arc/MetJ family transcriptional regulator